MNKQKIISSIKEYNKYHGIESSASIIRIDKNKATIKFSGSFCQTCGVNDYFDDFINELEKEGINAIIKRKKKIKENSYSVEIAL